MITASDYLIRIALADKATRDALGALLAQLARADYDDDQTDSATQALRAEVRRIMPPAADVL